MHREPFRTYREPFLPTFLKRWVWNRRRGPLTCSRCRPFPLGIHSYRGQGCRGCGTAIPNAPEGELAFVRNPSGAGSVVLPEAESFIGLFRTGLQRITSGVLERGREGRDSARAAARPSQRRRAGDLRRFSSPLQIIAGNRSPGPRPQLAPIRWRHAVQARSVCSPGSPGSTLRGSTPSTGVVPSS